MIPYLRHFCSLGYKLYFLFWKVYIPFQSAILPLFHYHKNTSQNATKKQDGTNRVNRIKKTTREVRSRVA